MTLEKMIIQDTRSCYLPNDLGHVFRNMLDLLKQQKNSSSFSFLSHTLLSVLVPHYPSSLTHTT